MSRCNPGPNAANFAADLNPESLEVLPDARIEPSVAADNSSEVMQFERQGYFVRDRDSAPGRPVINAVRMRAASRRVG